MTAYLDTSNLSRRSFLTKDVVSAFNVLDPPDQTKIVTFFATHPDVLPKDDLRLFFNLAARPENLRSPLIESHQIAEYKRYISLGLGPQELSDWQEDFSVAIRNRSSSVATHIASQTPSILEDAAFSSSLVADVVSDGDLESLNLLLQFKPDLNSAEGVQNLTALGALSQIVFHSLMSLPIPESDDYEEPFLFPREEVIPRFLPIMAVLLQHSAHPFDAGQSYENVPYTYKEDELPKRPELAFSLLAENKELAVFSNLLEEKFAGSKDAFLRWSSRTNAKAPKGGLRLIK